MNETTCKEMRDHRTEHFTVRAEPTRDALFDGEKTVYITYNGRQEYPLTLAQHEARQLFELLRTEFDLWRV
jgi:hypothetical protein